MSIIFVSKQKMQSRRYGTGRRYITTRKPPSNQYTPLRVYGTGGHIVAQDPKRYALSLLDSFNYRGVRIPDLACHPSVTYCTEADFTISLTENDGTNSNNDGVIIPLFGNNGWKYYASGQTGTPGLGTTTTLNAFGNQSTIYSQYDTCRLVSAQCIVKFAGNDTASGGTIVGAVMQATDKINTNNSGSETTSQTFLASLFGAPGTASTSFGYLIPGGGGGANPTPSLDKRRGAYMGPLSEGLRLTWKPTDADDFSYRQVGDSTWTNAIGTSPGNSVGPFYNIPSAFVFGVRSSDAAARSFTVSVVCNWEALPFSDTTGLAGVGCVVDPSAQAFALSVAASAPACTGARSLDFARQDQQVAAIKAL